jgi:FkbM family methyltransferase
VKGIIKRAFNTLGYEIHRPLVDLHPERVDPFLQKKLLLDNIPNPIVFDVGAHVGSITRQYRSLFPTAAIYSFEPFPESFQKLRAAFASDRLVHPYQLGFAEKAGVLPFNVNIEEMTNSLLMTDASGSSFWGHGVLDTAHQIDVEITTLDAFCQEKEIKHIDLLKIDTQGAEKRVLEGSMHMLQEKAISYVYTEILLVPTYKGQSKFYEVVELLDNHNYSLFSIYNPDYRSGSNRLLQVDAIFFCESAKLQIHKR